MSTRCSIKWREQTDASPGFHLYEDCLDVADEGQETPVYLRLDGVSVDMATQRDGATVTVAMPREMARELGLLPASAPAPPVGADGLPTNCAAMPGHQYLTIMRDSDHDDLFTVDIAGMASATVSTMSQGRRPHCWHRRGRQSDRAGRGGAVMRGRPPRNAPPVHHVWKPVEAGLWRCRFCDGWVAAKIEPHHEAVALSEEAARARKDTPA